MRAVYRVIATVLLLICVVGGSLAQKPDDKAANDVASAFVSARQPAHLSRLNRMDTNPFGEKVCQKDLRMPSGLINDVQYTTIDPSQLPPDAEKFATAQDTYKAAVRFGVGVCSLGPDQTGKNKYSVLIATYESRWTSFWRIFWE